jgi:uncharacterized protein
VARAASRGAHHAAAREERLVTVERSGSAAELLGKVGDYLTLQEAENNLLLGILSDLERGESFGGEQPYLACLRFGKEVIGVALRTPPFGVVLSEMRSVAAAELFADDVAKLFQSIPTVLGPVEVAKRFAKRWESLTRQRGKVTRHERIYSCERVIPAPATAGSMRPIRKSERGTVVKWMLAFHSEAMPGQPQSEADIEAAIDRRLAADHGGLFFWEDDGAPVALAASSGRTPNGIRIGPVYTPPERRRHGYATALVAGLTSTLLEQMKFCFLFTDLANPTSNGIYGKIGYVPVADVDQIAFKQH